MLSQLEKEKQKESLKIFGVECCFGAVWAARFLDGWDITYV